MPGTVSATEPGFCRSRTTHQPHRRAFGQTSCFSSVAQHMVERARRSGARPGRRYFVPQRDALSWRDAGGRVYARDRSGRSLEMNLQLHAIAMRRELERSSINWKPFLLALIISMKRSRGFASLCGSQCLRRPRARSWRALSSCEAFATKSAAPPRASHSARRQDGTPRRVHPERRL